MNPLAVNTFELVLDAFWSGDTNADGSARDVLSHYHFSAADGIAYTVNPVGRMALTGSRATAPALTLERKMHIDLGPYDQLVLCTSLPSTASITISACVDNAWIQVVHETPGQDTCSEFAGPIRGKLLQGLRIEISTRSRGEVIVLPRWVLLENRAAIEEFDQRKPVMDPDWPELMVTNNPDSEPHLGLFFDRGESQALREKLRQPHLRPHLDALIAEADRLMKISPAGLVGKYAPGGSLERGLRQRDLAKPWLGTGVADVLAFAGLVTQDPAYCRQAASCALTLAHCDHWTHSFIGATSGTTAHPRAFSESYLLRAVALVLDWCGHFLTPAGRELIRDAMIFKGLARVESDFHRWEYIRHMNQGLLFSPGRIYSYLALEKTYPRYRTDLATAGRDLERMLDRYVLSDGGTTEGMGYWHSLGETFPCLAALARNRNRKLADMLSVKMKRSGDFALEMLSTLDSQTEFLPVNAAGQGHLSPALTTAAVYLSATQDPRWMKTYAALLASGKPSSDWGHLLLAPASLPKNVCPTTNTDHFYNFSQTGHAGVHRANRALGNVRFHFFSGPCGAGHSHQDKGSFILEAGNEALALDRGTCRYENPAHVLMSKAGWHNLTVPEDDSGRPFEQGSSSAFGGKLLHARYSEGTLDLLADTKRAWKCDQIQRIRRRIWSPAADLFLIDDEIIFSEACAVSFRLNTPAQPASCDAESWKIGGRKSALIVTPVNWKPVEVDAESAGTNHRGDTVWLLRMVSAKAKKHRLLTMLAVASPADTTHAANWHWAAAKRRLTIHHPTCGTDSVYEVPVTLKTHSQ